ncbi:rRNA maturation endonuclease Nob1 [Mesonia hippocampi]|uniref:rRNA maturation endonuclease Nob1 n=1 Tax=Mesonia hippocampi TaxID=1628250 RepID=A0A840ERC6_9FLAO|nr:hypothetical protein [Mesonia hippocampi]MBB4119591.1 rRNA maturation endonuclease Nob1 [Mesonia hippocampi]
MENTNSLPKLIEKILRSKGANDEQISMLVEAGIQSKADFETIGDTQTLIDVTEMDEAIAESIMQWAVGKPAQQVTVPEETTTNREPIVVESADVVKCIHCDTKQPKDYKTGDLCISCGMQAEPVLSCHWCYSTGPGKFCRSCGAEFVASADYEVALYLKQEGESKNAIPGLIKEMSANDKENVWARIRKNA